MTNKPIHNLTYISLFSGAGIGCYGFKQENFNCIATVELLEKRLNFQRFNEKCIYKSGYISGDLYQDETKNKIFSEFEFWKNNYKIKDVDVLIATPPCQGMSIANQKKKNELKRNSLVVESIRITQQLNPKCFIFENVRSFLTTICTDTDNKDKPIKNAIENNLAEKYNILYQTINFKNYGNSSSRTRTLVIGTRKDILEITPVDILPDLQKEKTLKEVIGHLKPLDWAEIDEKDIYHSFKIYSPGMLDWIKDLKEGESAFDNTDITKIPHKKVGNRIVINANKSGCKYKRQCWDKVAPCIHTRNDIMSSQNTLHPKDNRVFSIREVALMMSIPFEFRFSDIPFDKLNALSIKEKRNFLSKTEMNIRHSIGEGVPTIIFGQIAKKIKLKL
jgi:DNA (cytosine-5)-methyltransferase 1